MATRAAIGVAQADGTIKAIYLHNDGYIGFAGAILAGWYNSKEKLDSLISLGALSSLGEKLEPDPSKPHTFENRQGDVVFAYHRDRGETLLQGMTYRSKDDFQKNGMSDFGADFLYLFIENKWYCYSFQENNEWYELEVKIEK